MRKWWWLLFPVGLVVLVVWRLARAGTTAPARANVSGLGAGLAFGVGDTTVN